MHQRPFSLFLYHWFPVEYADSGYSDLITALTTKKDLLLMRLKEREDELNEILRQESVRHFVSNELSFGGHSKVRTL